MLLNKISKYLCAWIILGTICYLAQPEDKPLPGSDFPKPDSTKISYGWDFEKQEYRYLEPNPEWEKPKQVIVNQSYDYEYDPVDELLMLLD